MGKDELVMSNVTDYISILTLEGEIISVARRWLAGNQVDSSLQGPQK